MFDAYNGLGALSVDKSFATASADFSGQVTPPWKGGVSVEAMMLGACGGGVV